MTSDHSQLTPDGDSQLPEDDRPDRHSDGSALVSKNSPDSQANDSQPAAEVFSETEQTVISKRQRSGTSYPQAATPLELGETLEGRRLDYFELKEFVGGGGMGAVFRAIDTKLGRTVAVKVLSCLLYTSPSPRD